MTRHGKLPCCAIGFLIFCIRETAVNLSISPCKGGSMAVLKRLFSVMGAIFWVTGSLILTLLYFLLIFSISLALSAVLAFGITALIPILPFWPWFILFAIIGLIVSIYATNEKFL
jgi:hypothetical protein